MGTEMPLLMTFQGASEQRKAIPIPAKIPKSLLREGTSRRAHAFLSSPYVTTYPSLPASVSAALAPPAVQQREHSSRQLQNL